MSEREIAAQINKTIEKIWMLLEKEERQMSMFQLNNQQHVLLTLIIRHPASSPTELAEKMAITTSAVSQQLTKLENDGYITKKKHPRDKRTVLIELGERGRRYKKELDAFHHKMYQKYYTNFSSAELSRMLASFQKLQQIMEETDERHPWRTRVTGDPSKRDKVP